jgi:hypothetical protein
MTETRDLGQHILWNILGVGEGEQVAASLFWPSKYMVGVIA